MHVGLKWLNRFWWKSGSHSENHCSIHLSLRPGIFQLICYFSIGGCSCYTLIYTMRKAINVPLMDVGVLAIPLFYRMFLVAYIFAECLLSDLVSSTMSMSVPWIWTHSFLLKWWRFHHWANRGCLVAQGIHWILTIRSIFMTDAVSRWDMTFDTISMSQ